MRVPTARHRAALLSTVSVAAVACCFVAFSVTPASAETSVDTTDPSAIAALVAVAAPDGAEPVDVRATGNAFETSTTNAESVSPSTLRGRSR